MDIERELEDAVREHFRSNNNLPMPHGLFPQIKSVVYADAIRKGESAELIATTIENVVRSWVQKGLCSIHDSTNGDITLTDNGYKFFTR